MPIPKIIHQIWIGPKVPPVKMMDTWKQKHPDFEYILWTEQECVDRGMIFECQTQIDAIHEIVGKADIMRIEILYRYGGVYVDADSICIEPLDDRFLSKRAFAAYENENVRKGLVATGTMGFEPGYSLCRDMMDWIKSADSANYINKYKAWFAVGPGLLTRFLDTGKYRDFSVFPSHYFLPIHFTGARYDGHKKVYAYQEWANTKDSYNTIGDIVLPDEFLEPKVKVSILITSYNTKGEYIKQCLDSIKNQVGHIMFELVWMNDGSDEESTKTLETYLDEFRRDTRFCQVVYEMLAENRGISYASNRGISLCNHNLIFRMDSDDIMVSNRTVKQYEYMRSHPDAMICGGNIQCFSQDPVTKKHIPTYTTNHPVQLTWTEFQKTEPDWFMNHPAVCFRKNAVLQVGNYNTTTFGPGDLMEDYDLELRFMKMYGKVDNLSDILLYYRLHPGQLTAKNQSHSLDNIARRRKIIDDVVAWSI
jgi:mannosyltransferase OCH1-like enzyme